MATNDDSYQLILTAVKNKAEVKKLCESHPAHSYGTIWDTISIVNTEGGDLLVYNSDKIIVPQEARKKILNYLHKSHAGSEAMFKTARASLWWPES